MGNYYDEDAIRQLQKIISRLHKSNHKNSAEIMLDVLLDRLQRANDAGRDTIPENWKLRDDTGKVTAIVIGGCE